MTDALALLATCLGMYLLFWAILCVNDRWGYKPEGKNMGVKVGDARLFIRVDYTQLRDSLKRARHSIKRAKRRQAVRRWKRVIFGWLGHSGE